MMILTTTKPTTAARLLIGAALIGTLLPHCSNKTTKPQDDSAATAAATVTPPAGDTETALSMETATAKESAPRPPATRMVFVVIDTLRADRLGCYGYEKPTTPTIDSWADRGVLFESFHAASPWTAPSFGTLFTGVSPTVHGAGGMLAKGSSKGSHVLGVTVGGIQKDLPTLPELLPRSVHTAAIVTNAFVSKQLGFHRGFDDFDHTSASLRHYRTADETADRAIAWLGSHQKESFFLLVHFFDPHIQYGPPQKYVEQFAPDRPRRIPVPFVDHDAARDGTLKPSVQEVAFIKGLYDGEVRFVDDQLARIEQALVHSGIADSTWLVVTSDHGEEHFEHGSFEHGHRYEEEVVRVPLVIRAPGGNWLPGTRIAANSSHIDLLPTLLELFGETAPTHLEGRSLIPLATGQETADRTSFMEYNLFHGQQAALYDGRFKLVWDKRAKRSFLYDLQLDPGETEKRGAEHPAHASHLARLQDTMKTLEAATRGKPANNAALSPEAAAALKSLGYVQ